jgi:micrococcal nuclease
MVRRFAILMVLVVGVAACGAATPSPETEAQAQATSSSASATRQPDLAKPSAARTSAAASPATRASSSPGAAAVVVRVVDGDTLKARIAGVTNTVRVIGLDTPESVKPGTPIECFALRASAEAKRLLPAGSAIRLEPDPTQARHDQYGRVLAHVWLADGTLYAERMIRGGFGIHYVYEGVLSIHAARLAAAEAAARAALRGLWSPGTCAGNAHTPAP